LKEGFLPDAGSALHGGRNRAQLLDRFEDGLPEFACRVCPAESFLKEVDSLSHLRN